MGSELGSFVNYKHDIEQAVQKGRDNRTINNDTGLCRRYSSFLPPFLRCLFDMVTMKHLVLFALPVRNGHYEPSGPTCHSSAITNKRVLFHGLPGGRAALQVILFHRVQGH